MDIFVFQPNVDSLPLLTLDNINLIQKELSVVVRSRLTGRNTKPKYVLLNELVIELSDNSTIVIPRGFIWDLASVPRKLWGIIAPDGDCELSALIHDFLYKSVHFKGRKFADEEMYKWAKVTSGTSKKWSLRNLDNWVRYKAVRLFGWIVWNRNVKKRNKPT